MLAPGAWLTGIAIPGADHLRTIAGGSPGENAARWIHLYAATLLLIIIVPRFALAGVAGLRDRRLTRCFPIALESAYFQRLLHARQEGTAHVIALPYSFAIAAANRDGLAKLLTRAFQSAVDIAWYPPVAYGDDALPDLPAPALAGAVRDDVDVVLYLVNASESPADAGYIAPELKILGWIGKPVIVLLNQTGRPRAASEEATELTRWRDALGRHPVIEGVLPLDAFARCWIQESVLLREVAKALPESKRAAFARLAAAWHATREVQFQTAMAAIAAPIARAARERVALRGIADGDSDLLANALQARLAELSLAVLAALYPDAGADALPPSRRSAENATPAG